MDNFAEIDLFELQSVAGGAALELLWFVVRNGGVLPPLWTPVPNVR